MNRLSYDLGCLISLQVLYAQGLCLFCLFMNFSTWHKVVAQKISEDFPGGPGWESPCRAGDLVRSLVWEDSTCRKLLSLYATTTEACKL